MHIYTTIRYFFYVIAGKSFMSNLYACKNMHVVGKSMHILGIILDSGWESFRQVFQGVGVPILMYRRFKRVVSP